MQAISQPYPWIATDSLEAQVTNGEPRTLITSDNFLKLYVQKCEFVPFSQTQWQTGSDGRVPLTEPEVNESLIPVNEARKHLGSL